MIFGLKTTIFLHDRNKTKLVHATLCYYHSYLPHLISALLGISWPGAASATTRLQSFMKLLQASHWIFEYSIEISLYLKFNARMFAWCEIYEIFYYRSDSGKFFLITEISKKYRLQGQQKPFVLVHFSAWASLKNNVTCKQTGLCTSCNYVFLEISKLGWS